MRVEKIIKGGDVLPLGSKVEVGVHAAASSGYSKHHR
jgi:hypothetical protein